MSECGLLQEYKEITLQHICCKARGLFTLKRQVLFHILVRKNY